LRIRAIQEPVFSVANTDFEGGDDDHGYGDCIFLVIHAQPSHSSIWALPDLNTMAKPQCYTQVLCITPQAQERPKK
jgi:hypothetical protein